VDRPSLILRTGFVFVGLLVPWLYILFFFDSGPVEDSDLALTPRKVDPAQNPYPGVRTLVLSDGEWNELSRVEGMLSGSEDWDIAFLREMLERHRPLLEKIHRYAGMREWKRDLPPGGFYADETKGWMKVAPLMVVESARLASESQAADAVGANLSLLRFASGLQSADNHSINWSMACRIRRTGCKGLLALLDRRIPGKAELERLAENLDEPALRRFHLDRTIRAEYAWIRAEIGSADFDHFLRGSVVRWIPQRATYKENRTLRGLAEHHRRALRLAESTLTETRIHTEASANPGRLHKGIQLLGGNWQGYELGTSFESSLMALVEHSFVDRAILELLRTRVALERYRLDHGAWPPDLAALVPGYLDSEPLDPIDGNPLRYQPVHRVLYSIGDNLIDEGGVSAAGRGSLGSHAEIVIDLEPVDPGPWPDFSPIGEPLPDRGGRNLKGARQD